MCFTNLPVEFDEDGTPRLADDADAVEHRGVEAGDDDGAHGRDGAGATDDDAGSRAADESTGASTDQDLEGIGCLDGDPGVLLEELEPDEAYEAVLETLPETAREAVGGPDPNDDSRLAASRDGHVDGEDEQWGSIDHRTDRTTREPAVIE